MKSNQDCIKKPSVLLDEPEESLMLFDEETESEHYHIVVLVIRADMI